MKLLDSKIKTASFFIYFAAHKQIFALCSKSMLTAVKHVVECCGSKQRRSLPFYFGALIHTNENLRAKTCGTCRRNDAPYVLATPRYVKRR